MKSYLLKREIIVHITEAIEANTNPTIKKTPIIENTIIAGNNQTTMMIHQEIVGNAESLQTSSARAAAVKTGNPVVGIFESVIKRFSFLSSDEWIFLVLNVLRHQ